MSTGKIGADDALAAGVQLETLERSAPPPPHCTDVGNGERYLRQHGDDVRFVYEWRSWVEWIGTHWRRDLGAGTLRRAKLTTRGIYAEAAAELDPRRRKELAAWATTSENEKRLRAMLFTAQADAAVPVDSFDRDIMLLNVENGTIDLSTGQLRPHRRGDWITRVAPVAYDPEAACPRWHAFLERIFSGQEELITFVQRALGYAITGDTREHCFFLLHGKGRNGKTTLLKTISTILGPYAVATRAETFMTKGPDSIPNDVAALRGARVAVAVEAEEDRRLAESLVKQMTGGDTMSARFMKAEFFQFTPTFKIFLGTNHRPIIRGTDLAMWSRVRLIPFTVTIPDAEQDKDLGTRLLAEASGILAWLVQGCRAWQRDGLKPPAAVQLATDTYRADMDILGRFLADRCILEPAAEITAKELYQVYTTWADDNREKPLSTKAFGLRLGEREGIEPIRTMRARGWRGVRLRRPEDPEPEHDA